MDKDYSVDIIIPTYKPDADFEALLNKLAIQSVKPRKIVIVNTDKDEWDKCKGDDICACSGAGLTEVLHPALTIPCHYGMFASHGGDLKRFYDLMTENELPARMMCQGEMISL